MQNSLFRKGLVWGIIVLFVGVSVAPGITAHFNKVYSNVLEASRDSTELVEITVQICKINGIENHTMKISRQQGDELDNLFDNIKASLDNAETMEETIAIFNDAVISLNEEGLLPDDMSVNEAQQLVTGDYYNSVFSELEDTIDDMRMRFENAETSEEIVAVIDDLIVSLNELGLLPDDMVVQQVQQPVMFENAVAEIKERLKCAKTQDETIMILNETIVSLYEHDLLPDGTSVEEVQKLITSGYQNQRSIKILEGMSCENHGSSSGDKNFDCLIAGRTILTSFYDWHYPVRTVLLIMLIYVLAWLNSLPGIDIGEIIGKIIDSLLIPIILIAIFYAIFGNVLPLSLGETVTFGIGYYDEEWYWHRYPSEGWVVTQGLTGFQSWSGSFYGNLGEIEKPFPLAGLAYIGATGFTGIKLVRILFGKTSFLGYALRVDLGSSLSGGTQNNQNSQQSQNNQQTNDFVKNLILKNTQNPNNA